MNRLTFSIFGKSNSTAAVLRQRKTGLRNEWLLVKVELVFRSKTFWYEHLRKEGQKKDFSSKSAMGTLELKEEKNIKRIVAEKGESMIGMVI